MLNNVTIRPLPQISQNSDFQSNFLCWSYLSRFFFVKNGDQLLQKNIFWKLWLLKFFIFRRTARFILLVGLTVTLFCGKKNVISTRWMQGFMPSLIKKSVTVSTLGGTQLTLYRTHSYIPISFFFAYILFTLFYWLYKCLHFASFFALYILFYVRTFCLKTETDGNTSDLYILINMNFSFYHALHIAN